MPKSGKNRLRFSPPGDGDQQAEVYRPVSLGTTRIASGQGDAGWVVTVVPDGNGFCV
jgi:hypothetical protein